MTTDWEKRLERLADELTVKGDLTSPRWQAAFRSVPRHLFVPTYLRHDSRTGDWHPVVVDDAAALDTVYSDVALTTDVDEHGRAVSSSSMPGLMTRMLELLDVGTDDRVLEVGTGTGYNAALLCAALGDTNVHSVDISYVDTARARLASLGYRPTLRQGDGIHGLPEHAPFDRIIATVAVPYIPVAWLDQLTDGGVVLADVKIGTAAGNMVLLRKNGSVAEGRFDSGQVFFVHLRRPGTVDPPAAHRSTAPATHGTTTLPAVVWDEPVPWFLACASLDHRVDVGFQFDDHGHRTKASLRAADGSWADIDMRATGPRRPVVHAGPSALWAAVERGYRVWKSHDRPGWHRLGLTVTRDRQRIWLDDPNGPELGRLRAPGCPP